MSFPVHQSLTKNTNMGSEGILASRSRRLMESDAGGRRGRGQGHTRNTPTNPTGCKPATTKQQIARMIPANEGKYAPTTDGQIESHFSLSLPSPLSVLPIVPVLSYIQGTHGLDRVQAGSAKEDLPDGVVKTITPMASATTYTSA